MADALSTHQGLLKAQLERTQGARRVRKNALEMLHRLKEWIGLRTGGRGRLAAKQTTQIRQPSTEPLKQMVECLKAERHPESLDRRFDRTAVQQALEQLPQPGGGNTVAREHLGQENTKGAATASAPATIGAKDPLPAQRLLVGRDGIIAVKLAVPI